MTSRGEAAARTPGERALIEHIRRRLPAAPPALAIGPGDDAAVIVPERGAFQVLTTDALVEGDPLRPPLFEPRRRRPQGPGGQRQRRGRDGRTAGVRAAVAHPPRRLHVRRPRRPARRDPGDGRSRRNGRGGRQHLPLPRPARRGRDRHRQRSAAADPDARRRAPRRRPLCDRQHRRCGGRPRLAAGSRRGPGVGDGGLRPTATAVPSRGRGSGCCSAGTRRRPPAWI